MKPQNLFGILLKISAFFAVLAVTLLALSILLYSLFEVNLVIKTVLADSPEEGKVILKALKAIDLILIGVAFFIIGTGLFELFIAPIDNLPSWLQIKNLDELKGMLIKLLVVIMGVSYTGRIVTWDGKTDLYSLGLGLGIVILAMSYFLKVKNDEQEKT